MTADAAARAGRHEAEIVGGQRSGGPSEPTPAPFTRAYPDPLVRVLAAGLRSIEERRAARGGTLRLVTEEPE